MCLYHTIHNGYLRHPLYAGNYIPFENIYRVWSCKGQSYCYFLAKEKDKEDVTDQISLSVGNAFKEINYPDLVQYHENGFVNHQVIETVFTKKTKNRTRKFILTDGTPLETSRGKTDDFDKLMKILGKLRS